MAGLVVLLLPVLVGREVVLRGTSATRILVFFPSLFPSFFLSFFLRSPVPFVFSFRRTARFVLIERHTLYPALWHLLAGTWVGNRTGSEWATVQRLATT